MPCGVDDVGACAFRYGPNPRPPNVILIMADDLGRGHCGCYGQTKIRTPHIDRLAAEGMKFNQFYAGANVCAPSRSVLMTGLHTGHTPVRNNGLKRYLYDEDVTDRRGAQEGRLRHRRLRQMGPRHCPIRPASPSSKASTPGAANTARPTPTSTIPTS